MKISFKILITTVLLIIVMIFAVFFNVKAEVNKLNEVSNSKEVQNISSFKHVVILSNNYLALNYSDKNEYIGAKQASELLISNDTLYINEENRVSISFTNLESFTSQNGGEYLIQNIKAPFLNINIDKESDVKFLDGEVSNIIVNSINSTLVLNIEIDNIDANLKDNSNLNIRSSLKNTNIKCDNNSKFNKY